MQIVSPVFQTAAAVTPSDSTAVLFRALYVGGAGTLSVVLAASGATVSFGAVTAGSLIPLEVIKVNSTGTTATNIVGLA